MSADAVAERESAIRHYLAALDLDPSWSGRYATVAARWEQLRLAQARGTTTPGDDTRMRELGRMVQALGIKLGLGHDLVDANGFLPRDPARIICDDWREHIETYF